MIKSSVALENLNLFIDEIEFECTIKLRYRTTKIACIITIEDNKAIVKLKKPAFGVACGQVAVFYQDEKVLGSGWIAETFSH